MALYRGGVGGGGGGGGGLKIDIRLNNENVKSKYFKESDRFIMKPHFIVIILILQEVPVFAIGGHQGHDTRINK